MFFADFLELAFARRALAARGFLLSFGNYFQLVEKHFAELLGRPYVEFASRRFMDAPLYSFKFGSIFLRKRFQNSGVYEDTMLLHLLHDGNEWLLDVFIHLARFPHFCQLFFKFDPRG